MRLPSDAALIVLDEVEGEALRAVWREERLPVVLACAGGEPLADEARLPSPAPDAFANGALETALDARGVTTLVIVGAPGSERVAATARSAAARGYRLFWVAHPGDADTLPEARAVNRETALAAARRARARERWKAARRTAAG